MDEPVLVQRAQQGDRRALEQLLRAHQEVAFRAAYLVTRNAADAEDVLQEAFLSAWHALDSFRPDAQVRPWLLRIVTNKALDRHRSRGREERLHLRAVAEMDAVEAPSPESIVLSNDLLQRVLDTLSELPARDQVVITHHFLLDLSIAEMAALLECPESTVRTRLSRALQRLREQLALSQSPTHTEDGRHA